MVASRNQAHNVQHDIGENVIRSFKEWIVQESRGNGIARHPDQKKSSDRDDHTSDKRSYFAPSIASPEPQRISRDGASVGRRVLRTFVYGFMIVVLGGIVWRAYGDVRTKEIIVAWGRSSLNQLSSVLGTKSMLGPDLAPESGPKFSDQAAAVTQSAPASVVAKASPELQQQFETIAGDLATVRRIVEQLAAKQEQMAQDIATLQAAELNVSQKLSSLEAAAIRVPPRKNAAKIVRPEATGQPSSLPLPLVAPPAGAPAPSN
jgi:hypothetical protein